MIKKSFLTFVCLFFAYQLFLQTVQPYGSTTLRGQHEMIYADGNIIRAERYLHGRHDQPVVVLGSSLTQMLERSLDPQKIACLAMPGMGVFDGLAVIERAGTRPRLVLLEINMLQRERSKELFDEFMQPELYQFRHLFSAARQEYQPANLIVPRINALLKGERIQPPQPVPARPLPADHEHRPNDQKSRLDWLVGDVDSAIANLPRLQQELDRLGLTFEFYQMPECPEITRSPAMGRLRAAIQEQFHKKVFQFPDEPFCTNDGSHLAADDGAACAFYLTEYANGLLTKSP